MHIKELNHVEENFQRDFGHLQGLRIDGVGDRFGEIVIGVEYPFIFDRRQTPEFYQGIRVHGGIPITALPGEFLTPGYVWAYQRYEKFVDRCEDEIRRKLANPTMTKEEMLDALCFGGDFRKWVDICKKWEAEGVIPKYED